MGKVLSGLFGGGPQIKPANPDPPPLPNNPATVMAPAGYDAAAAVQLRNTRNRANASRNRMLIPLSGGTGGTGVSIPK